MERQLPPRTEETSEAGVVPMTNEKCNCKAEHWQPHKVDCPAYKPPAAPSSVSTLRLLAQCGSMDLSALVPIADEMEQLRGNLSLAEEGLANYALEVARLQAESDAWDKLGLVQLSQENERLKGVIAGMIQGLKDADAEAREHGHEPVAVAVCVHGKSLAAQCGSCENHSPEPNSRVVWSSEKSLPPQNIGQPALNDTNTDHALNCPCAKCKADPIKQAQLAEMQHAQRTNDAR